MKNLPLGYSVRIEDLKMSSFKDLLRAKSARIVVPVFLSVFIALAAGISFSCSFLEDDGFFDKAKAKFR